MDTFIKFILWCATVVFYALSWACALSAVQTLMVYFKGVPLYLFGTFSLCVMCLAFFLAADWCWQKSKRDL